MHAVLLACLWSAAAFAQPVPPERLFREAVEAQKKGDDATAIRKYQELLKTTPDVVEVRANLGAALARQGRFEEAVEQYRAALAKSDNPALRMNLALAYYKKGAIPEALRQFEILRASQPGDVRIATLLADCYSRSGRDQEVIRLLERFEPSDNGAVAWLLGSALIRSGRARDGLPLIERLARREHSAQAYLLAGQTALKLSDFERARDHSEAAAKLDPKLPGVLTLRGSVLQYLGDNAGAIAWLRKALDVDGKDFDAHLNLGAILHTERELDESRKHLEKALTLNPSSTLARYQMARLERTKGDVEAAVRHLEQVIRQDPSWAQPHIELSALYFGLNRQEDGEREKAVFDRLSNQAR